jgi:hypothetical protein
MESLHGKYKKDHGRESLNNFKLGFETLKISCFEVILNMSQIMVYKSSGSSLGASILQYGIIALHLHKGSCKRESQQHQAWL